MIYGIIKIYFQKYLLTYDHLSVLVIKLGS